MKERICYVALDYKAEMQRFENDSRRRSRSRIGSTTGLRRWSDFEDDEYEGDDDERTVVGSEDIKKRGLSEEYKLPDGRVLRIREPRFTSAEILFQPLLGGVEAEGMHSAIFAAAEASPVSPKLSRPDRGVHRVFLARKSVGGKFLYFFLPWRY